MYVIVAIALAAATIHTASITYARARADEPLTADASAVGEWRGNPIKHERDDEGDAGKPTESGE